MKQQRISKVENIGLNSRRLNSAIMANYIERDTSVKLGFLRGVVLLMLGTVVAGLTLTGCKADIILPVDRGLDGDYAGILIIARSEFNGPTVTDTDHVAVVLRLNNPDFLDVGTYSHKFDSLSGDTTDIPDFCDMPRGSWVVKNLKLQLEPGPPAVNTTCNSELIPNSLFDGAGGAITEIGFNFRTTNNEPFDADIGDSLIITQNRLADGIITELHLVLTAIP